MKLRLLLITLLALFILPAQCRSEDLRARTFRDHVIDGFNEWEFLPSGKLLSYQYLSDYYDRSRFPGHGPHPVYPFLLVESLRWKKDQGKLLIGRYKPELALAYNEDTKSFMIFEHGYDEVKNVEFFEILMKYCGGVMSKSAKSDKETGKSKAPFRILRAVVPEGFTEYQFRSDGKVMAFYDKEKIADQGDNLSLGASTAVFEVKLLKWRIKDNQQVIVDHGDRDEIIYVSKDQNKVASETGTWERVDHLEFIPKLYAFCERPLPKAK